MQRLIHLQRFADYYCDNHEFMPLYTCSQEGLHESKQETKCAAKWNVQLDVPL